jgi:hypothetical protein
MADEVYAGACLRTPSGTASRATSDHAGASAAGRSPSLSLRRPGASLDQILEVAQS